MWCKISKQDLGPMHITLDFNEDFSQSSWDVSRRTREDSIQITYDEALAQNVARFNWKPGDRAHNGFRAELSDAIYPPSDTLIYYRYSLFIPETFTIEEKKYVLITQWHTPGSKHKPPLALRLRHTNCLDITLNHKDTGTDFSALGSGQILFGQVEDIKRGVWNDFEYLINWTGAENGSIEMKINQQTVGTYSGKTNYSDQTTAPYFKYGIYPPEGNSCELNLLSGPYMMQVDPDATFIISRGFNPGRSHDPCP